MVKIQEQIGKQMKKNLPMTAFSLVVYIQEYAWINC